MYRRVYVKVVVEYSQEGAMKPLVVEWEDGRRFEVDRLLDVRRAASTKAGGQGMRYVCQAQDRQIRLFFENPCWFVEAGEIPT